MAAVSPHHREGCARLGFARLKAFRLNVYESISSVIVDGVDRGHNFRIRNAAVQHILNDAPDTASLRADGFVPVAGQRLAVSDGDPSQPLFSGRILETTVLYELRRQNIAYDIRAIDPTWLLNRRRVIAPYANASATAIVLDIVARFTSGVTAAHVAPGLPTIPAITFTNETVAACLTAICERIGAYWFLDYRNDLHVFFDAGETANPITQADPRGSRDHSLTEDLSQVVTRVIARGAGVGAAVDTAIGATELPVDLGDAPNMYNTAGGIAEAGADRITYTGIRGLGATGATVGSGNAPTNAVVISQAGPSGGPSGLVVGAAYQYAVTFTTATGESVAGPVTTGILSGAMPIGPNQCQVRDSIYGAGGGVQPTPGGVYYFRLVFNFDGASYGIGPVSGPAIYNSKLWEFYTGYAATSSKGWKYYPDLGPEPPAQYTQIWIYRTVANAGAGGPFYSAGHIDVGATGTVWSIAASGYNPPDVDIAQAYNLLPAAGPAFTALMVRQIPTSGNPSITGRKVYRTAGNGSQLKLRSTLADNTTTSLFDVAADATLGANIPVGDTSGLTDNRYVIANATALPVSSTAPFEVDGGASGGWVQAGNMAVRYTGISAGQLTGVPATGVGSISANVRYGTQVLVQPRLVGVAGITHAIRQGDTVTIRIEVDDTAAQAAFGARIGGTAADGVVEEPYSDSSMTLAELQNYAAALLADRKDPRRTVTFQTRDGSCQVGRLITINLTSPPIAGTFRIQRVTYSEIAITGGLARVRPLLTVEASNKLYTFADLLRRLRGREGGAQ